MERDFTYLKEKYSIAGAREKFEDICAEVLGLEYGCETHQIRVTRGDGGIDVMVGDFSAPIHNFQCKFFLDGLGDSQKAQIRESLSTAAKNPNFGMKEWTLCVPLTLSQEEMTWWSGRKNAWQTEFDIKISLYDKEYLLGLLKKHGIYERVFGLNGERAIEQVNEIHTLLKEQLPAMQEKGAATKLNLPHPTSIGTYFVGRQAEMEQMKLAIQSGPVVLYGLGGIGKSQLAAEFCSRHGKGNSWLVRYQGSFAESVLTGIRRHIPELKDIKLDSEETKTAVYQQILSLLHTCDGEDILIIDNVDMEGKTLDELQREPAWEDFRKLPLKLILTTRYAADRAIHIKPMEKEVLYDIFRNYGVAISDADRDALIDVVKRHTMTIDLFARAMKNDSWNPVTAQDLLQALKGQKLGKKVSTDYGESREQREVYDHLRVLFDVVKVPEAARKIMRWAALLPQDGMDSRSFGFAVPEADREYINDLIKHGWLSMEQGNITIHPVIRSICKNELGLTDENCGNFLNAIWRQYDRKKYDAALFRQWAELFSQAADLLPDREGEWAVTAGYFWDEIAQSDNALKYNLLAVKRREENLPDSSKLATAYNNVGNTYYYLGDHQKALEYKLKDLAICEKVLPPEHPSLASSYNNVGSTYGALGDHKQALEYQLKALAIREKVLPANNPALATSYNNVGLTYGALGDHQKALEYQLKALAICEKVLPPEHPDLALSYNNVGVTYLRLGDHQKALEYLLKALAIRETVLPPEHPDLASSYNNVGYTYGEMGDYETALDYVRRAVDIAEKSLPEGHLDTENYRRGVLYWTYMLEKQNQSQ